MDILFPQGGDTKIRADKFRKGEYMKKLKFGFDSKYAILLLGVLLGIVLVACHKNNTDINPNKKLTVALDWYINPDHGPLLVAQAKGYFEKNGIDVSFISPTDTSAPSQLVCTGKADIALVYEPQLIAQLTSGMPLKCVGTLIDKVLCCIAVLESSDITKLSDLKNKTIGYSSDGTGHAILGTMLELDVSRDVPTQTKLVNLQMNLSQALLSRKVDAVYGMMRNVEPIQLRQQAVKTRLFYPENHGVPMYSELLFAVKKTHASDKKIANFLKSIKQGTDYIKGSPEAAWNLIAKEFKAHLAMTTHTKRINHKIWKATVKYFSSNPEEFDKKQFDEFARFLHKKGAINDDALNRILYRNKGKQSPQF